MRSWGRKPGPGTSFMPGDSYFLDTNILVYANDGTDAKKQETAVRLITGGIRNGHAVVSTQVLSEFWVTVTQKIQVTLDSEKAEKSVSSTTPYEPRFTCKSVFESRIGILSSSLQPRLPGAGSCTRRTSTPARVSTVCRSSTPLPKKLKTRQAPLPGSGLRS
jgi:hypothetical protein